MWKWTALSMALLACEFPRPADVGNDGGGDGSHSCTQTTCTDGVLAVCGASGTVEREEPCALGCFSDGSRCFQVAPSNGLAQALDQAAQEPAITLPSSVVVNSDTGVVTSTGGGPIDVTTLTVEQPAGPMLRVFVARSWTLHDVLIRGSLPVALVSSGDINVHGLIDASADRATPGPGALVCGSAAGGGGSPDPLGFFARVPANNSGGYPAFLWQCGGFGGGGFGTSGGNGGEDDIEGPSGTGGRENGNAELVPLRGGCEGGGKPPYGGAEQPYGGTGGGALQLVSGRSVHLIVGGGVVHVGGGGGIAGALGRNDLADTTPVYGPAGGGSGGGILIEAPQVILDEGTKLLASGGGGGGYGACTPAPDGLDAPPDAQTAVGGSCPFGTKPSAAGGSAGATGQSTTSGQAGSGGGGLGRIRLNILEGHYAAGANSVVLGATTVGTLGTR